MNVGGRNNLNAHSRARSRVYKVYLIAGGAGVLASALQPMDFLSIDRNGDATGQLQVTASVTAHRLFYCCAGARKAHNLP